MRRKGGTEACAGPYLQTAALCYFDDAIAVFLGSGTQDAELRDTDWS